MNITTYLQMLPVLFKSKITPLVWGYHGTGKSSAPQQYADKHGHKLVNLRLGNMEAGELLGLMDFSTDPVTGDKVAAKSFMPDWLQELFQFCAANPDKWGILHLDEINHIRRDLQSFIWQMCLDSRLHVYNFPSNLAVIASANPPTRDYPGTLDFKNKALLSRFCHVAFRPDAAETLSYLRTRGGTDIASYLTDHPQMMSATLESFSVDEYCKPSSRSWEAVARLQSLGAAPELIYGMVGVTAAESYFAWLRDQKEKAIDPAQILDDYAKVRKAVKEAVKEQKYAELKLLCEGVQSLVLGAAEVAEFRYSKAVASDVMSFTMDLPNDLAYAFLLVVLGPSSTALMNVLDGEPRMDAYLTDLMSTIDLTAKGA